MIEKSPERLEILKRISEFEKQGWWEKDVEDDPPTVELLPNQIDYLNKKLSSKIKTFFANIAGTNFFEKLIKNKGLIIKEVKGIENFLAVRSGAIITCNHFNACDNYAVWKAIKPYMHGKKLWKVIREGNYTNSPPPFGFVMRNCNTLPLSSNTETMKNFMLAVKTLLKRGEKILIYPEQGMWWNYRKPRPMQDGAFNLAVSNSAPIIPVFITMEDSEIVGPDGFFVQAYTVNILPAIYPDENLKRKERVKKLKDENYECFKNTYEQFYKIKLTYEK
ncbi:MAG: 1-acyl-sn-glycerol-3-phosphate acyltransferase [Clostridia bacterium]|nr:1-acyl-sn-glycerol-3-phosphate acyltransferase [Clostridia bacterium]